MPDPAGAKLPDHLSHSSRESLERCAKSWFLKYMTPAPRRPALWLAGGSAVHEVTEAYDRDQIEKPLGGFEWTDRLISSEWRTSFGAQLKEMYEREPNEWNWNRSKSEPIETWDQMGPAFIRSYIDWRKRSPYELWTTPDGLPAIELDVSGVLPGCPVPIHGYVDRIFRDPVLDKLIDVDLKSGKKPPKTGAQFETYAALMMVKYDVVTDIGVPFMNRKGTLGKPHDLTGVTPEAVGAAYGAAWEQIQTGQFPANTSDCFICDVSASCYAANGPLAHLYDPDHPAREVIPF